MSKIWIPQFRITPLISGEGFCVVLFFPFAVYLVWDALLWLWGEDSEGTTVGNVLHSWIVIDCFGLFLFLSFAGFELYERARKIQFNYELAAMTYIVISTTIILVDYWINRSFYFPARHV